MSFNNSTFNNTFFEDSFEGEDVKVISFYTPLVYVSILIISLMIFASQYRKRQIAKMSRLPSLFDEHQARDLYKDIKQLESTEKVHEKVLKGALLNRGAEAVRRTIKLKEIAPQIEILYKNGSIGEDYWQRYQTEIKLVDLEFKECIQEAEILKPGWAQLFVTVCKEICFNQALRRRYNAIDKRKQESIRQWALNLDNNGRLIE